MPNWQKYCPPRAVIVRFFKYSFLLLALAINIKIVFDGFSYYLARRSLDGELESKKIASLEHLGVLTKRSRAYLIDTLETRCLERNQLAMFRILDAGLQEKLQAAHFKSLELRSKVFLLLGNIEKEHKDWAAVVDLAYLKETPTQPTFTLARLRRFVRPVGTLSRDDPAFQTASAAVLNLIDEQTRADVAALAGYEAARSEAEKEITAQLGRDGPYFKSIEVLEQRLARLKEARATNQALLGTDNDDLLSRYAVWTEALTGGFADNPVLDEMRFQLDQDDRQKLGKLDCKRFGQYVEKVSGRPFEVPQVQAGPWDVYQGALYRFFNTPPVAQTLLVTLFLGALGALTINSLRLSKIGWWSAQPDPAWGELVLSPLVGALAAFGIFLLGSAGLLLTGDSKSGSAGATALSPFFIGMLGFISGLLYDEAFGRVRRFGAQFFAGDDPSVTAGPEDLSLAEALRTAKATYVAELFLKFGIGKRIASEAQFTLLVPSDEAMSGLTLQAWKEISEPITRSKFETWFRRHHATRNVNKSDVAAGTTTEIETEAVAKYPLEIVGDVLLVNKIKVVQADISWGNGVIHILEADVT